MAKKQPKRASKSVPQWSVRESEANDLIAQLRALLPIDGELPKSDRRTSKGRIGAQESLAMRGVVDAMDAAPDIFASLADQDDGVDPTVLETSLIRERLDEHDSFARIADALSTVARMFADHALLVGSHAAPVVRAAYKIAKVVGKSHPKIMGHIVPMANYRAGTQKPKKAKKKALKAKSKGA